MKFYLPYIIPLMKIINFCNRIIEFSFYALFLLVPIVFSGSPSELFEFPKMWLTFGITTIIGASWIAKMILQKRIFIQRTPLDIPLILFLASQIISTIFSLDPHVSLWGYYSRFNGGLLSIISYIFLYYAFVSNLETKHVLKVLKVSLFSGLIVALWGFPSHFGWDPTCYIFRGSFDTSCWTDAFKPTIRIFSTLGQPAWLAAYMSVLIPLSISYFLRNLKSKSESSHENQESRIKNYGSGNFFLASYFLLLTSLFYACLTYTDTRGGFIGFWIANIIFWAILFFKKYLKENFLKYFLLFNLIFIVFNFFSGVPISQLSKFTLPELNKIKSSNPTSTHELPAAGELGGTDSGKIRLLVWRGAIDAWKANPIIGTGVETFAFAYYRYRPVEHNVTSEWDYLYNKAHNEYLNYLATTGAFGLGSYLAIIGLFIFQVFQKTLKTQNDSPLRSSENLKVRSTGSLSIPSILITALFAGWVSILVSNFFGFSVVIINLYFFLIPAFIFILSGILNPQKVLSFPSVSDEPSVPSKTSIIQWILLVALLLTSSLFLQNLFSYWSADLNYANGSSLDKVGSYQEAITPLQNAVNAEPNEPVYKDELSINLGTLASALYLQKDASGAAQLSRDAITISDNVINTHPNNIVYWKNRVRLFYTLAQSGKDNEKNYYGKALSSIIKARELAPNDAKISYNYGVLAGQTMGPKKGIEILEHTIKLKPDYRDAYFALGLFYHEVGDNQKAINTYQYILKNIDLQDKQVQDSLKIWGK